MARRWRRLTRTSGGAAKRLIHSRQRRKVSTIQGLKRLHGTPCTSRDPVAIGQDTDVSDDYGNDQGRIISGDPNVPQSAPALSGLRLPVASGEQRLQRCGENPGRVSRPRMGNGVGWICSG